MMAECGVGVLSETVLVNSMLQSVLKEKFWVKTNDWQGG